MRRFVLLPSLFGLLVLLATAVPAAAEPPLPAHNGWIAFASDRSADRSGIREYGIYRLDPVGSRISSLGVLGRQPAWSPDGSLLAFVQDRFKLVVARPDGTRIKTFRSAYPIHEPSWSPTGARIVLRQTIGKRFRGDLALVDVTKGAFRRLTHTRHDDTDPAWSPDGAQIAFVSDRHGRDTDVYRIRPSGRGLRALTANPFDDRSPAWSPDGDRIAFVSGREAERFNPELWTMDWSGRDQVRVQPASGPGGFPVWSETGPAWSPDGRWLVYVSTQRWHLDDLYIVSLEDGAKIDLTPESAFFDLEPSWQPVCHLAGTSGRDDLRGTDVDELVCGHGGPDAIDGKSGSDRLFGGVGDDRIRSVDGIIDVVGCGTGRDAVIADRGDIVGLDCERVRRR